MCSDGLSLSITREETENGLQMLGKFNFGVITGVFRFEQPEIKNSAGDAAKTTDKRKCNEEDMCIFLSCFGTSMPTSLSY